MRFRDLLGELHRRSVWQILGSYAVVAWIILQLAETLEGLIGLPLWFGPAIVVVVLLGFPVLLITALTQGGWRRGNALGEEYSDSAQGGDPSLSSWKRLDRGPFRSLLGSVFTWRNALVGGLVMAVLLMVGTAGYSGLRSAGIGPLGSLVAKGVFESNESLILAEFQDRTGDGTLAETVTALFRIDLAQSSAIQLLDRSKLTPALVRMERDPTTPITHETAMEIAQREGVKAVVSGEVLPLGPGAVVSVRLVGASSGETLVALRETARTVEAVPEAVDRLSAQLRERIGESLRSIQADPPLEEVTTGSLEALQKYVQAEWALDMGDINTAEALVREAITLDSTFSMAHRKLGVILSNEGRDPEAAKEAFSRAYEGRDRLSDRERLLAEAAYHTYVSEELDSAIFAYEGVLAAHPTDPIAGNNLAVLYGERDQLDKAVDLYVAAIEEGHAPAVAFTNAIATLYELDQPDSARTVLTRFSEAYPNHPQAMQYSAALASADFRFGQAEEEVRSLLEMEEGNARWEMWGEAELGSYALIQGRLNEGAERMLRAHALQEEAGTTFTELPASVMEALGMASIQYHFLRDPEGAGHTLDQLLSSADLASFGPGKNGYLELATLYAQIGRSEEARDLIARFRSETPDSVQEAERWQGEVRLAEAAVALSGDDPERAIGLIREGRQAMPKCELCGLVELGDAFRTAAMTDSAAAAYQAYLDTGVLFRSRMDNTRLHRALLGLAESQEMLGQPSQAAELYRRQLNLWSRVDPGLQPRVQELVAKVRALVATGETPPDPVPEATASFNPLDGNEGSP